MASGNIFGRLACTGSKLMSEYDKLLVTWQVEVGLKLDPDPWQENVEARLASRLAWIKGRSPVSKGDLVWGIPLHYWNQGYKYLPCALCWYPHNLTK